MSERAPRRAALWRVGAALGLLSVLAGAFGAHGLEARLSPAALETFETGARYAMYHALAMLVAVGLGRGRAAEWAASAFAAGIVLFCGSLFVLALTGVGAFGAVAPIGGVLFLAGWVLLAIAGVRSIGWSDE